MSVFVCVFGGALLGEFEGQGESVRARGDSAGFGPSSRRNTVITELGESVGRARAGGGGPIGCV